MTEHLEPRAPAPADVPDVPAVPGGVDVPGRAEVPAVPDGAGGPDVPAAPGGADGPAVQAVPGGAALSGVPVPRTVAGRAGLGALLDAPGSALVALDFDGTLAPIVTDPASSRLAPGGLDALRRLAGVVGTLAVVTGRPAAEVVALAELDQVPGVLVAGQYGAEHWAGGMLTSPEPPPAIAAIRRELPGTVAAVAADHPGVWIEDKGLALVVHTRPTAEPDAALARLAGPVHALAARHGLTVHPGRLVLEIRAGTDDKGAVLRRLVADRRPTAVLFAGDDLGDLPAFAAVEELRAAGVPGLTVASRSAEATAVADRADLTVDGPPGVIALLAALTAAATTATPRVSTSLAE
jgi:trehalose 6-phosphate phosphatase